MPPQITACASQARVNFCTIVEEDQQTCPKKQVTTNVFFSMKQQDRSSERDQVAKDFAMKTLFFIFLIFTSKFEGKIRNKGE